MIGNVRPWIACLGVLVIGASSPVTGAEIHPEVAAAAAVGPTTYMVYIAGRAELDGIDRIGDRETRGRQVLERLQSTARRTQAGVIELLRGLEATGEVMGFRSHFISNVVVVTSGAAGLRALERRPEVERIEPVRRYRLPSSGAASRVTSRAIEWNIIRIGAPVAWAAGTTGTGVVVATLDTGARYTHQAIVGQYRGNLGGGSFSHDFNWHDATGLCPPGGPCDDQGYGTGMVSLLVGDDGGANQVGVAPGADWVTVRACESAACSSTYLLAGAEWLIAPCPVGTEPGHRDCDPDLRPDVVAIGWTGGPGDPWYQDAVDAWRAAGITPVIMAGNAGPASGTIGTPGCYCNVMAVGGVDQSDVVLSYSSRGPGAFDCTAKPELVAPTAPVRVATNAGDDTYGSANGTGASAAEVAGCAALVKSAAPWLEVAELRALLLAGADDIAAPGFDYDSGWGVVRCDRALAGLAEMLLVDDFERGSTLRWTSQTPPAGQLVLFDGGSVSGAIGGRAGADAMCAAAVSGYPGVPTANTVALLTVDAGDEIRDLPWIYGVPTERTVVGPSGSVVANDWADLLDGSIEQSLGSAGVLTTGSFWYSGSTAFGTLAPTTCTGWTHGSALLDGRYGYYLDTDSGWIARSDATCGSQLYHVLCLAWE